MSAQYYIKFNPDVVEVENELEFLENMRSLARMRFHPTLAWVISTICLFYLNKLLSLSKMGIWYVSTVPINKEG